MIYGDVKIGKFIKRPNRFIANVLIDGKEEVCHVKNTGRCKELLIEGVSVFVEKAKNPNRKTKYDLISVYKGDKLINIDSQAPNKVVKEWIESGNLYKNISKLKPEATFENSRLDFFVEGDGKKAFVEVKGVTLEENGVAMFPDAPTTRGIKHLLDLKEAVSQGYEGYACFVIQMEGIDKFVPNERTHKEFAEALEEVEKSGVKIKVLECTVDENSLYIKREIENYR